MNIEELIKNKSVLMIPVYSTRSYKTGVYDLLADGNVSKFAMKILKSDAKKIDILYPNVSTGIDEIKQIIQKYKKNVKWIPYTYGLNAHETRNMGTVFFDYITNYLKQQYDYIISEIDTLAEITVTSQNQFCNSDNFIYWAGSWNAYGTPWYDVEHSDTNIRIANKIITACLLPGQVDLYGGKSFYDVCEYDPKYFEKQIIFFPFRLSDKSYCAEYFREKIKLLLSDGYNNFVVLYTDVNDCGIFDNEEQFYKVPSNKFVYQAILKGKPIIPYFDDVSKNYHSNIFEFNFYGCDIITDKENFYNILKEKLEGK